MHDAFQSFYRPTEEQIKVAWDDATFVLDTNILLNLYRYPIEARDELLKTFRMLGDRLWVPFHVGLEFQRNRLTVIAEQQRRFSEVKEQLQNASRDMRTSIARLQLKKRHSTIDADPVLEKIEGVIAEFIKTLDAQKPEDRQALQSDPIREQLDVILKGRVGNSFDAAKLAEVQKQGELRYTHGMPPGFADSDKGKRSEGGKFTFQGLTYDTKFGDLLVWQQLIAHAREKKIAKVIFLTDDEKEDWWSIVEASGAKKMGPRSELVEEIAREAGVSFFHMYNSESFLYSANEYLHANVQKASIAQVADVLKMQHPTAHSLRHYLSPNTDISRVVVEWLDRSPSYFVENGVDGIRLIGLVDVTVQIALTDSITAFEAMINDLVASGRKALESHQLLIIVISDDLRPAASAAFHQLKIGLLDPLQSLVIGGVHKRTSDDESWKQKRARLDNPYMIEFIPRFYSGKIAKDLFH